MVQSFFIAKSNLMKKKSNAIIMIVLLTLATVLFDTGITVLTNMNRVIDQSCVNNNTADWLYLSGYEDSDKLSELIRSQEEVAALESSEYLYYLGTKYKGTRDEKAKEFSFCLESMEQNQQVSKLEQVDMEGMQDNSILLPFYFSSAYGYEKGDTIQLTFGKSTREFVVLDFFEDVFFATPINISIYKAYISQNCMEELKQDSKLAESFAHEYRVKLKDGESLPDFYNKMSGILPTQIPELSQYMALQLDLSLMKKGVTITPSITLGITFTFSVLLLFINIVIIRFSVRNFIEENLPNVGVMQAAGYSSGQLIRATMMEMTILSVIGIVIGLTLGMLGSGVVGQLQASLMGLHWNIGFDVKSALMTIVIIFLMIWLITYVVAGTYKKITPLAALRGGIHTHNFKNNYFPLHKSHMTLSGNLGMKQIFHELPKNIGIFIIVMLLALASCMGFVMNQYFARDTDNLMDMVGIEVGTAIVSGADLEQIGKEMEQWEEVREVRYFDTFSADVSHEELTETVTCDVWKEPAKLEHKMVVDGRLPEYDNEVLLTTAIADKLEVKVGDIVYIEGSDGRKDYIVVGLNQQINHMGLNILLTMEGEERLNQVANVTQLYLTTIDSVSYEQINEKILEKYDNITIANSQELTGESVDMISSAVGILCEICIILTVFVVMLIVLLIIKAQISREKKNYGVYKAIGFTTGQLILQTVIGIMPVLITGAVIGAILSIFTAEPMLVACLSFCGIQICNLDVNISGIIITILLITIVGTIFAVVSSLKIRKIEPMKMLTEE